MTFKVIGCIMEQDSLGLKSIGEKTEKEEKMRRSVISFTIAILVLGFAAYSTREALRSEKILALEEFPAQLAEQNRQADVASQLRAAEMGDFAEMLDGTMLGIWWTATDTDGITKRVVFCGFGGRCTIDDSEPISLAAKRVERIIKLNGPDQLVLSVAKQFMRQY